MELEFLKESIKNCIEIRRTLWTALFGLIGGLFALSITPVIIIPLKVLFCFIDSFFIVVVMLAIHFSNNEINEYLEKIRRL